jgi:membrane protease subunit HflC
MSTARPLEEGQSGENKSGTGRGKKIAIGLGSFFAAAVIFSPLYTYTIKPSDMGNVRRLGTKLYNEPLESAGLQFKIPFIDSVDTMQVNLKTLHIPKFTVNTVDNQQVTLSINFNYTVPKSAVNFLMYGIGKTSGTGIDDQIITVAKDRIYRVFSQENTTLISANRETIQEEVQKQVFDAVTTQFNIAPHSLQIAEIGYSDTFVESNDKAVRNKNEAVKQQNNERVQAAKSDQARITAEGQAKVLDQNARGDAESSIIVAQAKKDAAKLTGEGQGAFTKAMIGVFGNDPALYNRYLDAVTALKWNGERSKVEANGGNATVVIPSLPGMKPAVGPQ